MPSKSRLSGLRRKISSLWSSPRVVLGTSNQASFSGKFAGAQCTSMALTALALDARRSVRHWSTKDIDQWLERGHATHVLLREVKNISNQNDGRVSLDNILSACGVNAEFLNDLLVEKGVAAHFSIGRTWHGCTEVNQGTLEALAGVFGEEGSFPQQYQSDSQKVPAESDPEPHSQPSADEAERTKEDLERRSALSKFLCGVRSLFCGSSTENAAAGKTALLNAHLRDILQEGSGVVTVGDYSFALIRSHGMIYLLDSHGWNSDCQKDSEGTAMLKSFRSVKTLTKFLAKTYKKKQYQLMGFTVGWDAA